MLQFDPARPGGASEARSSFVLYLEGPGDRGILEGWSRTLLPGPARRVFRSTVILGGRRPERAAEHFRELRAGDSGARGLCVLDRDDGLGPPLPLADPGLEFYTWGRRHIESYLLVPEAIRRGISKADPSGRVGRLLRRHLPPEGDEAAWRDFDAKRVLAPSGPLARAIGAPLPLGRIAGATRSSELHPDVHEFFGRLRDGVGFVEPEVIR